MGVGESLQIVETAIILIGAHDAIIFTAGEVHPVLRAGVEQINNLVNMIILAAGVTNSIYSDGQNIHGGQSHFVCHLPT